MTATTTATTPATPTGTSTEELQAAVRAHRPNAFADAVVIAKRNLIKIKRVPDLIVFTTLSPIMFVLLFAYVFGSASTSRGRATGSSSSPGSSRRR